MALFVVLAMMPAVAVAAHAETKESVSYLDYNSDGKYTKKTITEYKEITGTTMSLTNGWYVVSGDLSLLMRLYVDGSDVRIIIKDGATLNANSGIRHAGDSVLFIYGQQSGTGKLIAHGTADAAGIGGNSGEKGGTLNVHGVSVKAYGGQHAAGIGGGYRGGAGAFYSYAGSTYAEGGTGDGSKGGGAGIGGGYAGGGGYHQIYGGDIEAHGGNRSAGIGTGHGGQEGQIYIKHATVKAYGGYDAPGIGVGYDGKSGLYSLAIDGGVVYAEGKGGASGIGGGPGAAGVRVTSINGGKVTALAGSGDLPAFGHGRHVSGNSNTGDGDMVLAADLMVRAGSSASNASVVKTNRSEDKIKACHSKSYAEFSICKHTSKTYTYTGQDTVHRWTCDICGRIASENHRPGSNNKCVCGADMANIWVSQDGFYLIYSENHWNKMCDLVDNNQCGAKKFRLMNDIKVSRPAGVNAKIQQQNTVHELIKHCFNGTFDGGGHTIEFNFKGTTPSGYVAPFMVVRGTATIKNLHIKGTIHNTSTGTTGGVGGLIGLSSTYGSVIENVRISSELRYEGKSKDVGGFIAGYFRENSGWADEYKGCVFDGKIFSDSKRMTGFHAKDFGGKPKMEDCLFIPTYLGRHDDDCRTFSAINTNSLSNCFYVTAMGGPQESGSKQVYSVKSISEDVTIGYAGSASVKYGASRYTRYGGIIDFNGTCYAPKGASVKLKIKLSKPELAGHVRVNGSTSGVKNNGDGTYTFTMPAKNAEIDVEQPLRVRFLNEDGSVFHETSVLKGQGLSKQNYPANNPMKESDADYIKYTFNAWKYRNGDIPKTITESIDITPEFTKNYRVNFVRDDGTQIAQAFYPEGTKVADIAFPNNPTKDKAGHYRYEFDHWDKSEKIISAETTYTAHFREIETDHDWSAATYEWAADNSSVTAKRICRIDSSHIEEETAETEAEVTKPAECLEKGETTYTASFDNDAFETQTKTLEDIDATGHDWQFTFETTGNNVHEIYTCSGCDESYEVTRDLEHEHGQGSIAFSEEVPATCEKDGVSFYILCSCGAKFRFDDDENLWKRPMTDEEIIIPALGHDYRDIEGSAQDPTCISDGKEADRRCSRCESKLAGELISATGHSTTVTEAVPATCTEGGNSEYRHCENCDLYFGDAECTTEIEKDSWLVAAIGHDWDEPSYTWSEDNSRVTAERICRNDASHVEREVAEAVAEVTKEPTCTVKEEVTYTGDEYANEAFERQVKIEERELDSSAHDWGEWEVTEEPTETTDGKERRLCRNDPAHIEHRTVPANAIYRVVSGDKNIWYKESKLTSDFTFKRSADDESSFSRFAGIYVDGLMVADSDYSAESGSVIIKLKPKYLETLSIGDHILTAEFYDGSVDAEFTIAETAADDADDNEDKTGDKDGGSDNEDGAGSAGSGESGESGESGSSSKAAATGDDNELALWWTLFAAAMLLMLIMRISKSGKRRVNW